MLRRLCIVATLGTLALAAPLFAQDAGTAGSDRAPMGTPVEAAQLALRDFDQRHGAQLRNRKLTN